MKSDSAIRVGMASPETGLLLLLSKVCPSCSELDAAQVSISEGLDWDIFLSHSFRHGTYSIIYKNLLKLHDVPGHVLATFRNAYHSTLRLNIQLVSELDRILLDLEKRGICAIPLKGPIASEAIFGDIGLYPGGDLDILIKLEDLDGTRQYLEAEGYTLNDKSFDEYREFFIKELYHISLSGYRFTVEPHWNLFFRYFTTPPEFWWEESIRVSSDGREYTFLSPEKNVLYTTFRLFTKLFTPLRFLVMVEEVLRHYRDEMDWEKLFRYARRYKFEGVLRVTMKLSRDMLGAPVPEGFADIRGLRARVLFRVVRRMVLHGVKDHPLRKLFLVFLRDDLMGAFRVLFERLFPSKGEIVSRYRVPGSSPKAFFYYILNPLILLMKRDQKI